MFKIFFRILAFTLIFALALFPLRVNTASLTVPNAQPVVFSTPDNKVRVMSYNLLSDGIGFYGSPCNTRKDGVYNVLNSCKPHIICLQECNRRWFNALSYTQSLNSPYKFVEPLKTELFGYMTAIFYNSAKLSLVAYGNLPLPHCNDYRTRRAVYAVFRLTHGGNIFCVINTHFSRSNRSNLHPIKQGLFINRLALELQKAYNCPVIVAGDFNAKERGRVQYPSSVVYDILATTLTDTRSIALSLTQGTEKSVHSANNDHIFLCGDAKALSFCLLSHKYLESVSDHYPIFADILLN